MSEIDILFGQRPREMQEYRYAGIQEGRPRNKSLFHLSADKSG
jgi:hypothetical protein